jgi:predicted permease
MLITLGVALARLTPSDTWEAIKLSVIKAAVTFVLPLWVGLYFDLPAIALAVLVIQVATPVPVTSYLLARKYEANSDKVAGLVVVSTLLSVAYLPLMLAYFL